MNQMYLHIGDADSFKVYDNLDDNLNRILKTLPTDIRETLKYVKGSYKI